MTERAGGTESSLISLHFQEIFTIITSKSSLKIICVHVGVCVVQLFYDNFISHTHIVFLLSLSIVLVFVSIHNFLCISLVVI